MSTATEIYYDPYDFDIDTNPHPVWKRMRDERPLYHNEKFDFYALTRFDDVERGLKNWQVLRSGRGTVLEMLQAEVQMPPGMVIFEDPPTHEVYRGLLSRVFTPRKMNAIEPQVRELCASLLDPLVGSDRWDYIIDLGAVMPMRVIGMLLGIPEKDQQELKERLDDNLRLSSGEPPDVREVQRRSDEVVERTFGPYVDFRTQNPSNDLMTDLINAEFEDHTGARRKLSRVEVLNYIRLLASAGNETTTKLIGWTAKVLSDHPDERRKIAEDRALVPNAIEEILRYEAPSPIQARYVAEDFEIHGATVPAGSALLLINGSGNRDERRFEDADRFDVLRQIDHHLSFGYGLHFCLGAALARLEGRVALDEVIKRFPDFTVDIDNAVQARTSTVRGWDSLPVVVG
jgi:cytochrome P450